MSQREGVTKRNQVRSALGSGDSCDSGYFQGITLGRFQPFQLGNRARLHADEGFRFGFALGGLFLGDVHHANTAGGVVVGKASWHAGDSSIRLATV